MITPADQTACLIHLVSVLKAYRSFLPRAVPCATYDAAVSYAEGLVKAVAAGKIVSRSDMVEAMDRMDRCTSALESVVRSLPTEVVAS